MCVTDHHDMTLTVNTTSQPTILIWPGSPTKQPVSFAITEEKVASYTFFFEEANISLR